MKKLFTFLTAMLMASSFANADDGATKPSKCIIDGEEFYELYSVEDLRWFNAELNAGENLDINAILRNDIEINDSWITVPAFYGVFDGNDHCIKANNVFIGNNIGTIKNLYFEKLASSQYNRFVTDNSGIISNCKVRDDIGSCSMYFSNYGSISNSYLIEIDGLAKSSVKFGEDIYGNYGIINNCAIITERGDGTYIVNTTEVGNESFEGEIRIAYDYRFDTWESWVRNDYKEIPYKDYTINCYENILNSRKPNHFVDFDAEEGDENKKFGENVLMHGVDYYATKIHILDSLFFEMDFLEYDAIVDTFIYERKLGSNIATFCFPFNVAAEDVNGEVYQLADFVDNTVAFKKSEDDSLMAGYPYVVKGEKGSQLLKELHNVTIPNYSDMVKLPESVVVGKNSEFLFYGSIAPVCESNSNVYAFSNDKLCQFDTLELRPFRAAFVKQGAKPSPRPVMAVSFDGELTGVMMVENNELTSSLVNVYDINGRVVRENVDSFSCLENLAAGIYIVNGEKFIVKEK